MYAGTVCASLIGSFEQPTTAMVRYLLRISFVDSSVVEIARDDHATPAFNPAVWVQSPRERIYNVTIVTSTRMRYRNIPVSEATWAIARRHEKGVEADWR